MKMLQLFCRKTSVPTNSTPTISSLKSEELWQFIERPEGGVNADSRASDLAAIWENAYAVSALETSGTGHSSQHWAISSH